MVYFLSRYLKDCTDEADTVVESNWFLSLIVNAGYKGVSKCICPGKGRVKGKTVQVMMKR